MKKIILGVSISALVILALGFYSISARADKQNQGHDYDRPVNSHEDNRDNRNGRGFNPNKELSKSACGDNLGKPVIDVKQKVQNDRDDGVGSNIWAFDYYTRNIKVWPVWNVVGTYKWLVLDTYEHDMVITNQNSDGTFSGIGGYPARGFPYGGADQTTETITGKVIGNQITFTTTYAGPYNPGYTATVSGTIAPDGLMSGTSPWEWHTTAGAATKSINNYCAIVTYDGNFYAVPGQRGPGGTSDLIDTPTNAPVNGDMSGGRRAIITGTLLSTPVAGWPNFGTVTPVSNYKCDISGNCPGYNALFPAGNWAEKYFDTGFTNVDQWWGWKYDGGSHGTWINASTGNSGNIL